MPGSKETSYQIEIFLKIEDDSVVVSRDTDKTPILRSLIEKTSVQDQKDSVVKGMLMKRPVRLTSPEKNIGEIVPVTAERMSWSIREVEWFSAEKRLLFITENALERDFWILNILKACESIHND